jgi:hypothetical protein
MVKAQYTEYRKQRECLTPGQVMIVQDFTKVDYMTHNQQDHIVVLIFKQNQSEPCVVEYHHFVGHAGEKNDVEFSMWVWTELLHRPRFYNRFSGKEILLWSDNGPKHFKCTAYLHFMQMWAQCHANLSQMTCAASSSSHTTEPRLRTLLPLI